MLQALIEKQFPAADRRRVADLFGIDSDASDKMSDRSSPALGQGTRKRRRQQGQSIVNQRDNTISFWAGVMSSAFT